MPQIIGDVFGLNFVYEKQIENIENNNFAGWPESGLYVYFGGGYGTSLISRIDFSTETGSTPGKNLPPNNYYDMFSTSSEQYGYLGNAYQPSTAIFDGVLRLDYSNEIVSNPGMSFSASRTSTAAVDDGIDAFIAGGWQTSGNWPTLVQKFNFYNETQTTINPAPFGRQNIGGLSGTTYGYFAGGTTAPAQTVLRSEIYRLDFSTEVTSANPIGLPQNRTYLGSIDNKPNSKGYYLGGSLAGGPSDASPISTITRVDFTNSTVDNYTGFPLAVSSVRAGSNDRFALIKGNPVSTHRFDFSSEIASLPGKNVSTGARSFGFASKKRFSIVNKSTGYFIGGYEGNSPSLSTITRIDFSTETSSDTLKRIAVRRRYISTNSFSTNQYGYFGGGWDPTANTFYSLISRLDFTNEVSTDLSGKLTNNLERLSAVSSNSYGYFGGGRSPDVNTITRLDFSNETLSNPGKNLPNSQTSLASANASALYGYFGGGYISNLVCRLDFSNETISNPGNNFSSNKRDSSSLSSSIAGYFGGGESTATIDSIDYTTEIVNPVGNLISARSNTGTTASYFYGYFSGGGDVFPQIYSNTTRLDFSNHTTSTTSTLTIGNRVEMAGMSNSN